MSVEYKNLKKFLILNPSKTVICQSLLEYTRRFDMPVLLTIVLKVSSRQIYPCRPWIQKWAMNSGGYIWRKQAGGSRHGALAQILLQDHHTRLEVAGMLFLIAFSWVCLQALPLESWQRKPSPQRQFVFNDWLILGVHTFHLNLGQLQIPSVLQGIDWGLCYNFITFQFLPLPDVNFLHSLLGVVPESIS